MKLFAKISNRKKSISKEHLAIMNCSEGFEYLIKTENKNHEEFLKILIDTGIHQYGLNVLCLIISNQVRYSFEQCLYNFDEDVLDWANEYPNIQNLPFKFKGMIFDEEDFFIESCPSYDLEFLAKICIEKTRECDYEKKYNQTIPI